MASRKLTRDILFARQCHRRLLLHPQQVVGGRSGLSRDRRVLGSRGMSIFGEFRKQVKGEAKSNTEFQQSVEELNKKVGGIKEELESKAKQTKDKIYKQVDGIWTEAESTTKKVSATVIEKISAAKEEVKGSLGLGEKESSGSSSSSSASAARVGGESTATYEEEKSQNAQSTKTNETDWQSDTLYGKFKSTAAAFYPKVSLSFGGFKEARVLDLAKKGYSFVKDELNSTPAKRKKMQYASSSVPEEQRSTKTDMVVVPTKQSRLGKKWEAFKEKMRGHPVFKRATGISEPVITKSHELAEDMRERWETSDHPVVHKIQDLNETVFGETATALSFKEIRRRDPSFSLPDFVAEVQEMIKPTLTAYLKCDFETLKKYCSPEVIERCKGERTAYESQGYFFENKILHISDVEVRETKMMGSSPIIIVAFQTQQIYCIRDRQGSVTAGGKDSIQTVYYAWAMQLFDAEELGETSIFPTWRLREMQQIGVQSLI